MYFVKYGAEYLHDPRNDDYKLFDVSLEGEENTCGYCDFTIYPSHPMYNKIRERDADNPVEVYDEEILLFSGYIYELGKEFYMDGHVKCRGELDYLSESIVRPYSTVQRGFGDTAPYTINGYFEWLIEQHNNQVSANKRFTVGINQGGQLAVDNHLFRENDKYPTTFSEINEQLLEYEGLGGYLRIRHDRSTRYIDYISEWTESNAQILDFGKNLTDYTQTDDSDDIATYVIPLGCRMSETEYSYNDGYFKTSDTTVNKDKEYFTKSDNGYSSCGDLKAFESGKTYYEYSEELDESNLSLTLEGLSNLKYDEAGYIKNGDCIYCEEAVKKYGWIGVTYENTDIKDRETLLSRGTVVLKELTSPKRTIEIKAIDMHLVNPEIKPIRIGEYVRVRSKPHKLDSYFLCTSISLDLDNPENSSYTLGTTFDTLTGQQNKRIKLLNASINSTYEEAAKLTEQEKRNAMKAADALKNANAAQEAASSAVKSIVETYAVSNSPTDVPEEGWTSESPEWAEGTYIWKRTTTTYGDGKVEVSSPVMVTGNSGKDGTDGEDAIVMTITSSNGTVFKNDSESTVLTAHVFKGGIEQIITDDGICGSLGSVKWYAGSDITSVATSKTLTVSASSVQSSAVYTAQLEGE